MTILVADQIPVIGKLLSKSKNYLSLLQHKVSLAVSFNIHLICHPLKITHHAYPLL